MEITITLPEHAVAAARELAQMAEQAETSTQPICAKSYCKARDTLCLALLPLVVPYVALADYIAQEASQ